MWSSQAGTRIGQLDDTPVLTMADTARRLCEHAYEELANVSRDGVLQWDPIQVAEEFMRQSQSYLQRNRGVLVELAKSFRLGCISNNWGNTVGWCKEAQLDELFDTIIDSTVAGVSKPDQLIFQAALDEMKLPAQNCAYVGDNYEADIFGSTGAGLTSVWVTGGLEKECPDPSIVDHRIETLKDILTINW